MEFYIWLQRRLTEHGHPVGINGDWGRVSIEALKAFQRKMGLRDSGIADDATVVALRRVPENPVGTVAVPPQDMPPWMAELHRRMGLHEVRDKSKLIDFLKIGKFLGNPSELPWCGDAVESPIAKTLPSEPLPANPFWAQGWAKFGIEAPGPIVGAIGVIRWTETTGHVGVVAGVERDRIVLLGGNQQNAITLASFPKDKFIAYRWPSTFPIRQYPALRGTAMSISGAGETR